MNLVTVLHFENVAQAHIYKSKLESEGIAVFLKDENIMAVDPLYNVTVGGVKLQVSEDNFERAKQILGVTDNLTLKSKVTCPFCGSKDIISSYNSTKGLKSKIINIIALLFQAMPIKTHLVYKCKNCDYEFEGNSTSKA